MFNVQIVVFKPVCCYIQWLLCIIVGSIILTFFIHSSSIRYVEGVWNCVFRLWFIFFAFIIRFGWIKSYHFYSFSIEIPFRLAYTHELLFIELLALLVVITKKHSFFVSLFFVTRMFEIINKWTLRQLLLLHINTMWVEKLKPLAIHCIPSNRSFGFVVPKWNELDYK